MLILSPHGGLCNRLRAIASANKLVNEYNDKLSIIWQVNNSLGCKFQDMFKINELDLQNDRFEFRIKGIRRSSDERYTQDTIDKFLNNYKKDSSKKYCLETFSNFYYSNDYAWLELQDELKERLDGITNEFGDRTIGVHIRRTDNIDSINNSPIELFFEVMDGEIAKNQKTQFFVATDDISTKNEIINKYKDRIITNKAYKTTRKSAVGMKDAAIDLFALAACDKIYGSFWSSFSEVAADIGNTELEVVKKDK